VSLENRPSAQVVTTADFGRRLVAALAALTRAGTDQLSLELGKAAASTVSNARFYGASFARYQLIPVFGLNGGTSAFSDIRLKFAPIAPSRGGTISMMSSSHFPASSGPAWTVSQVMLPPGRAVKTCHPENALGSGLPRSDLRKLQIGVLGPNLRSQHNDTALKSAAAAGKSQDDGRCDENPCRSLPCRTEVHSLDNPGAVSSLVGRGVTS
jgi:hypothetical protein